MCSTDRPFLKVFIVENHQDSLTCFKLYFEGLGHSVHSAITMMEALENIPLSKCDFLLSDIGLPDGDGWEMMTRLRPPRPMYAVAMSGFGTNSDRLKSLEVGFRRHLLKPVMPDELDAVLTEAIEAISAQRALAR